MARLQYPAAKRVEHVDVYKTKSGELRVADPYRWLEDPDAEEVKAWVDAQVALTDSYLQGADHRARLTERLTALYDYPKHGCPWSEGEGDAKRYYFDKNDGLQNHAVIYVKRSLADKDEDAKVFFDPNALAADGTVSLRTVAFSRDGSYFAHALSTAGSDWSTIKIKKASGPDEGELLPDVLSWCKFTSISWTHDNLGFFYARYPAPAKETEGEAGKATDNLKDHHVCYHRVGTKQEEDIVIYGPLPEHPQWNHGGEVTDDGKWLLIYTSKDTDPVNLLYIASLEGFDGGRGKKLEFVPVVTEFEAEYDYITHVGNTFYFKTNKDAPRYKVVSMDITNPGVLTDVIPQHSVDVLSFVGCVHGDHLVVAYMRDVADVLELWKLPAPDSTLCTRIREFALPTLGTVISVRGRKRNSEMFFKFSSFLSPGTIFHVDLTNPTAEPRVIRETVLNGFDPANFQCDRVFYPSKDGTKVPMFVVHHKDLKKDGTNPTWLYAYGGFSIPLQPYFSSIRLTWLQHYRGILAIPCVRGGGEYGEEWHKQGVKEKKQTVFDDIHAAAEYLAREQYTSSSKIVLNGGSNGGLMVCACLNQRPDLYGAGIAAVGVLDMLRFHKFTIGHFWCSEYGNPDNTEGDDAHWLYAYSPYHNVKARKDVPFPALLLTTADHDDRVSPLHSFKMAAELQHTLGNEENQTAPLLIRIDKKAGHGAGKPTAAIIAEYVDGYAFVSRHLGLQWYD